MDDDDELYEPLERSLKNCAIFDRKKLDEEVPPGFSSVNIPVDLSPTSSLSWEEEKKEASSLIEKGYNITFELELKLELLTQARLQTTSFALDECRKALIDPFSSHIDAIIMKRYDAPFKTLDERDREVDFLEILRTDLPSEIPVLLLFCCKSLQDPYSAACMFAQDRFSLFTLGLKESPIYTSSICYDEGKALLGYFGRDITKKQGAECREAIVMPRFTSDASMLKNLVNTKPDAKIISEEHLALEWEGVDLLYVVENSLHPTTLRLIAGFVAAGGVVVVDQNQPKHV